LPAFWQHVLQYGPAALPPAAAAQAVRGSGVAPA
jgi:hypothetical protein